MPETYKSPFPEIPEMEECEICKKALKTDKHIKGSYLAQLHKIALKSRGQT
ncbi:MAG: hypothetical protein HYW89_04715 [Candidatus Sungiibacteriota bacterium]|uniref:Uncharacterized protein n=1 Tax=Candidatus Sungiibacteriota bacterium TaxID=2750080 RepID=A0A7T5RJJ0_9BACT|nr:MAG: hypothetical protein HYW89_04715 [Candidatus Sungbacteria bacterium]